MATKLYVGNLPWSITSGDLEHLVVTMGLTCSRAEVVYDRETDRSRGFGFLHFDNDNDAAVAQAALNGYDVKGRVLVVNEATSRQQDRNPRQHRDGGDRGGGERRGRRPRGFRDDRENY